MVSRRSLLGLLGGGVGLLGVVAAPLTPWFDFWQILNIKDPVTLQIRNTEPVDHTLQVTITDRSETTVFEDTINIGAATDEEPTDVELDEPATTKVGEYRVAAELETGEREEVTLRPINHSLKQHSMPDRLHIVVGVEKVSDSNIWIKRSGGYAP